MSRSAALLVPLVLALAAALAVGAAAAQERELDPRVFEIARDLRCPTCVSESVAQSSSPIAREMRLIIQEQLDGGATRAEVLAFFQERYGDWILLEPPRTGLHLLVWTLPAAAAAVGLLVLALLVRRWRAAAARSVEAAPEDLARVRAVVGEAPGAPVGGPAGPDGPRDARPRATGPVEG